MKTSKSILLLTIVFCLTSLTAIGGERLAIPDGIYYHRFISAVNGPEAIWINPAGLGSYQNFTAQYMLEYFDGKLSKDWGFAVSGDKIGIGVRRLEDFLGSRLEEYSFAVGVPIMKTIYTGFSYQYIKDGPGEYNKKHLWNVGLLLKPNQRLSYGVVLTNLNRGRWEGEKTDFEQIYGISYTSPNNRLIFSVELSLSSGQNLSNAEYYYGLQFKVRPDLTIYGDLRSTDSFQIGLKWFFTNYFIGGQARFDDNRDHLGSTLYGGYKSPQSSPFGN